MNSTCGGAEQGLGHFEQMGDSRGCVERAGLGQSHRRKPCPRVCYSPLSIFPPPGDEFHDWYDLEHIPERLRVPGFLNAERWIGEEIPKVAVATYDLENHAVMQSAPYKAIGYENASVWTKRVTAIATRLLRFAGEQVKPGDAAAPSGAGGLLAVSMNVDPAVEHEFNEWYNSEHLPQLGAVPGVLSARRFSSPEADCERKVPWRCIT